MEKIRAKDIISDLADFKDQQKLELSNYTSEHDSVDHSQTLNYSMLEKKFTPHRIALTAQELELLVKNDSLSAAINSTEKN